MVCCGVLNVCGVPNLCGVTNICGVLNVCGVPEAESLVLSPGQKMSTPNAFFWSGALCLPAEGGHWCHCVMKYTKASACGLDGGKPEVGCF